MSGISHFGADPQSRPVAGSGLTTHASRKRAKVVLAYCLGITVTLAWLFPLIWMFLTSFKARPDIFSRIPSFVFAPTLDNYTALFENSEYVSALANSVKVAGLSTAVAVVVGVICAYPLSRIRFAARDKVLNWILSLRMMPAVATVVPFYLILHVLSLLDSWPGLVAAYLSFSIPFATWMLIGFFQDLPRELDEAAVLDGCSHWQTVWHIHLPNLRTAMAVTAIFTFVFAWNELALALMLTEVNMKTVPVAIVSMIQPDDIPWGQISAGSTIMLIPMVLVVFALQKHIVSGLTLGAVK